MEHRQKLMHNNIYNNFIDTGNHLKINIQQESIG